MELPRWIEEWTKPALILGLVATAARWLSAGLQKLNRSPAIEQAYLEEFRRFQELSERENQRLREENRQLRERLLDLGHTIYEDQTKISQLIVQNRVLENRLATLAPPQNDQEHP